MENGRGEQRVILAGTRQDGAEEKENKNRYQRGSRSSADRVSAESEQLKLEREICVSISR